MPRIRCHPGEILREEFMVPLALSARQLASQIGVPANQISELMRERRGLTAVTAIRLGKCFGTDARFWLTMQQGFELSKTEAETGYSRIEPRAA